MTPQADGSVRVVTTTTLVAGGVDGTSIDTFRFVFLVPTTDSRAKTLAIASCCPDPDVSEGEVSTVGTVRAWPDASGHPGFHLPGATFVEAGFPSAPVVADADGDDAGTATLDPCVIAPILRM